VAVWVAEVGADLVSVVLGLGEELAATGCPGLICLANVRDADVEKGADPIRVGRRDECDRRLVVSGPPAVLRMSLVLATSKITGSRSRRTFPPNTDW
jgi:hypothetical protein